MRSRSGLIVPAFTDDASRGSMQVTISNFGPIKSATFDVKPFMVLVGPNNSGKSIAMAALSSLLSRSRSTLPSTFYRALGRPTGPEAADEQTRLYEIAWDLSRLEKKPSYEEFPSELKFALEEAIARAFDLYSDFVSQELARTAGADIRELRRKQAGRARTVLSITNETPAWSATFSVTASAGIRPRVSLPAVEDAWNTVAKAQWTAYKRRIRRNASPRYILHELISLVVKACFRRFPYNTKYLPAARSGLIQSQRALAQAIFRNASAAGIQPLQVPTMSGVVTDFLGEMIASERQFNGSFNEEATLLENEILHGTIESVSDVAGYQELTYRNSGGVFPIYRTSSMVSEIAPVVVYLRHILQESDLLLIEEPEAHLHPQAQIAFARNMIRLVNSDLDLCVTTHSEFFLQQINNGIVSSALPPEARKRLGIDASLLLKPSDVSAYLFSPAPDDGTEVVRLEITQEEGIPEREFAQVAESLYQQSVALEQTVRNAESE